VSTGDAIIGSVLEVVLGILWLIQWLVIIAAVISWLNPDPRNPIVQFLFRVTEPILRPFRRLLPPGRTGGIDFSPLLVIILLVLIRSFLRLRFSHAGGLP
jgi:YggT family protein